MTEKKTPLPKTAIAVIHVIAAVLMNLGIVFSGVYILFHILDKYNPHGFLSSSLPWLPVVIPLIFLLAVLLYDLLFFCGAFKQRRFNKARMWLIILCDLILFAALSVTIYLKTCTNMDESHAVGSETMLQTPPPRSAAPVIISETETPAPELTAAPETPAAEPTDVLPSATDAATSAPAVQTAAPASPTPSSAPVIIDEPVDPGKPTEAPTPIPGLLGSKYAEKFSSTPKEQSFDPAETTVTLDDGTERALIYSYSGKQAAVDIYHYKKGKLEYQIADVYVRDIACLPTEYEKYEHNDLKTQGYMERIGAIVAVNGDNFNSGRIEDGIVIRNGAQLFPQDGAKQTSFSRDVCVIDYYGEMHVYDCVLDRINYDEILSHYPYHAFNFGPKLLNDDGTAKEKFNSTLGKANPRTAIGYYEPGHYAFIVILGIRGVVDYNGNNLGEAKSPGMTLTEMSQLCADLKMKMAYNLDGGGSSSMSWDHSVFGNNDRKHGDVIAVVDP